MSKKNDITYYSRRELVKEIANRNRMNYYEVSDVFDLLYDVIIEKFASGDNVEIGLFSGLHLTCKSEPIRNFNLKNVVKSNHDYILNIGTKTTRLLKDRIRKRTITRSDKVNT